MKLCFYSHLNNFILLSQCRYPDNQFNSQIYEFCYDSKSKSVRRGDINLVNYSKEIIEVIYLNSKVILINRDSVSQLNKILTDETIPIILELPRILAF